MKYLPLILGLALAIPMQAQAQQLSIGAVKPVSTEDDRAAEGRLRRERGFYRMDCVAACAVGSVEEGNRDLGRRFFRRYLEDYVDSRRPRGPGEEEVLLFPHPGKIMVEEMYVSKDKAREFDRECFELLCNDPSFRDSIPENGFDLERLKQAMKRARDAKAREAEDRRRRDDDLKQQRLRENAERERANKEKSKRDKVAVEQRERLERIEHDRRVSERTVEKQRIDEWEEMRRLPSIPLRAGGSQDEPEVTIRGPN